MKNFCTAVELNDSDEYWENWDEWLIEFNLSINDEENEFSNWINHKKNRHSSHMIVILMTNFFISLSSFSAMCRPDYGAFQDTSKRSYSRSLVA